MPHRPYKDDVQLSIIGFGGIVVVGQAQTDADREVARANSEEIFLLTTLHGTCRTHSTLKTWKKIKVKNQKKS